MRRAGLRMVKHGAERHRRQHALEAFAGTPSSRGGSSALTIGLPAWTSTRTWEATSRMIRSTSAGAEPNAGIDPSLAQPIEPQARRRD